jgi:SSS family solute:Na+ symporter
VSTLSSQQVSAGADGQPLMATVNGSGQPILDILPNFGMSELALMIFILPIAISWWANWYPGAEPGGGSYIAQRMLASKSEKDALGGTLFFNVAHYVLRPWPWIITALCSIIVYPDLASIKAAFPNADASLIGHDSAFPAMLMFLPEGFVGLMIGGLLAANSSTILTHLNWGSSYLVHDFYRRFIRKDASESHYVNAGRLSTVGLYVVAALLSLTMSSAQQAFQVLLSIGAGTGLIYVARWFWWRVSAWCEIVAMAMSLATSLAVPHFMPDAGFAMTTIVQVGLTTIAWLVTAFVGPETDRAVLISFVQKVKPAGPGWTEIRAAAGLSDAEVAQENRVGAAFVGVDRGLSGHLVVALRHRQLPVRRGRPVTAGFCGGAHRRLRGEWCRAVARHTSALGRRDRVAGPRGRPRSRVERRASDAEPARIRRADRRGRDSVRIGDHETRRSGLCSRPPGSETRCPAALRRR